jgi:hypothetical protein
VVIRERALPTWAAPCPSSKTQGYARLVDGALTSWYGWQLLHKTGVPAQGVQSDRIRICATKPFDCVNHLLTIIFIQCLHCEVRNALCRHEVFTPFHRQQHRLTVQGEV